MPAPEFQLPPRPARHFLAESFDATSPHDVAEVLLRLSRHIPDDFRTAHEWFSLFQEASAAISETHTVLELQSQRDNLNKTAESKLRYFEENVLSQLLLARQGLMDIYLNSPWRFSMHADDRGRIAMDFRQRRKYASPKLTELQIAENQLVRDYRNFVNSAETRYAGRSTPLSVIIGKMNDNKGETRKQAFLAYWEYVHKNEHILQGHFHQLLQNRCTQADTVGAESYTPIAYAELGRIDYGPAECEQFRASVKKSVVPIISEITPLQLQSLATPTLKPWDGNAWPVLMPTQHPANGDLPKLLNGMENIATRIHPSFGKLFLQMREKGLIDVEPRSGKSPGAFCVTFQESRVPFIFGNFAGTLRDSMTLIHEFGHAIHGYATATIPNVLLRHPGLEFCEVASMGLEMLAARHLQEWWPEPAEASKAWAFQVFHVLNFWPFMAMIDEWQFEVYEKRVFDAAERNMIWKRLSQKYKPQIDWSEQPELEPLGWFSRPHVFTSPFYYIDYGIAQLGAAQLWRDSVVDPQKAVDNYIHGLSLGAQRSLPELFEAIGLNLDFSAEWLFEIAKALKQEITKAVL